jgi:uncharacterized protein DUF6544
MMIIAVIAALALTIILLAGTIGRQRFRFRVSVDVNTLFSGAAASIGPEQLAARYDNLPDPVRRYLHFAIPAGAPATRAVRLKHDGFFRTRPKQNWLAIRGEEYFTVAKPGFVWNASIRPAPFLFELHVAHGGRFPACAAAAFALAETFCWKT